jgi:hypothetical protein
VRSCRGIGAGLLGPRWLSAQYSSHLRPRTPGREPTCVVLQWCWSWSSQPGATAVQRSPPDGQDPRPWMDAVFDYRGAVIGYRALVCRRLVVAAGAEVGVATPSASRASVSAFRSGGK